MEADTQTLILLLTGTLLVIAAAATLAPMLKIPGPLILVVAGIGVSLIPGLPDLVVDSHVILLGLLPPLLYASATALPLMNVRREFTAINGLSIVLVVLSSLALGALFMWLIPGLDFGWGVALGAILSPTDAVATSIIKGRGVPERVCVILDGEGLLNDASALIVLRTAIVATALGFSFWSTLGNFVLAIAVSFLVGRLAAMANLAIRRGIRHEAVNTILSFTTPFVAALPAEYLHGSGLVAAVVAGFYIGGRARRELPPGHRVSDLQNWATIEIVLEGVIFLTMGLQLSRILGQLASEPEGMGRGLAIAAAALAVTLAIRGAYVKVLLWRLQRSGLRNQRRQPEVAALKEELEAGRIPEAWAKRAGRWGMNAGERTLRRLVKHSRRYLADLEYLARQPLGRPEITIVIWAGMRGAVTVAAAQLLPETTPHRPLLVFIAFAVAAMSLVLQGGTIGWLVRRLYPPAVSDKPREGHGAEMHRIRSLMHRARESVKRVEGETDKEHRLTLLRAQRIALLDAADDGLFDAEALVKALRDVDIDELVLELRSDPDSIEPA